MFDLRVPVSHYVETEYEARQWIERFCKTRFVNNGLGLDTETTGVDTNKDVPIIWSMSDGVDRICLDRKFIPLFKEPILESEDSDFDIANPKFDAHMLANVGVDISKAGEWRDIGTQSWLHDENKLGRHGLKENIVEHFGRQTPEFTAIFGKIPPARKGQVRLTTGDIIRSTLADPLRRDAAHDYASLDAYNQTVLRAHYDRILEAISMYDGMNLKRFFYEVEVPFTKVLWKLERRGFQFDIGHMQEIAPAMKKDMSDIESDFFKAAGKMINLNSTPQLREFFFTTLGKTPIKYTDGGASGIRQPSTDSEVLEEWAGQGDEFANLLIRYRSVVKIYGTYVLGLQEHLDVYGRIHTTLNQHGAVTGRLSSSDPNVQNIPRVSEDPYKIREAFVASKGHELVVADYEQLEMRLMAHFSRDQKMIDAILAGIDIHCLTVAEMSKNTSLPVTYDQVNAAKKAEKAFKEGKLGRDLTQEEEDLLIKRQNSKATGFGIIYGIGGKLLAHNLTRDSKGKNIVTEKEGFKLIEQWFVVFPGVHAYIEGKKNQISAVGYVQTLMGRFRRFGDLRGMGRGDRALAERQGVNAEIQGSAADIAKMSMLKCESDPELIALGAKMLLQVHDELIFDVPTANVAAAKKRVKAIMEDPFGMPLLVPLPVSVGSGYSWASAK